MSKYTTEVRFYCETLVPYDSSKGYRDINYIIRKAAPKIFNFDYPIFDEKYRLPLEIKILKHFYLREIGFETIGLWKLALDSRMNEIMPYYNKLYESELLKFDPLADTKFTRSTLQDSSSDATNTQKNKGSFSGSDTANNIDKYSDTPSGDLNGILKGEYLSNARVNDNKVTTKNATSEENKQQSKSTNNMTVNETVQGKTGGASFSTYLKDYRESLINIDKMIIEELNDLFLNIY